MERIGNREALIALEEKIRASYDPLWEFVRYRPPKDPDVFEETFDRLLRDLKGAERQPEGSQVSG